MGYNLIEKLNYLLQSALNYWTPSRCPFCKSEDLLTIDRKYWVTVLKQCNHCGLLHRHPYDKNSGHNQEYYENTYKQRGITTDLPNINNIEQLKQQKFKNTGRNIDWLLPIFEQLLCDSSFECYRMIDYGCSWGYMTYQFQQIGFMVQGYEISRNRAAFGVKNLSVDIKTSEEALQDEVDVFFSSHVIEHHPSIYSMIALAKTKLKSTGYFIALCPNGSEAFRLKNPALFHRLWGKVHPNMITDKFYKSIFSSHPFYIATLPLNYEHFSKWDGQSQLCGSLEGDEIFIVCRPHLFR